MENLVAVLVLASICLAAVMAETDHHEDDLFADLRNRHSVSLSANRFAIELTHHILEQQPHKNCIVGIVGAYLTLSLMAEGAYGYNKVQMLSYLHYHLPEMQKHGIGSFINRYISMEDHHFRMTFQMFHSHKFNLKKQFEDLMITYWKSSPISVDFTKTQDTLRIINDFVKRDIGVKDYFGSEHFVENFDSFFMNVIFFSGKWAAPFEIAPESYKFELEDKSILHIPMMRRFSEYGIGYLHDDNSVLFIQIPFQHQQKRNSVYLYVLMFDKKHSSASEMKSRVKEIQFSDMKIQDYAQLDLYLPKFKINSTWDFEHIMPSFGMTEMWKDRADFTNMADQHFKINKFLQKATIDVNEQGSTIAHDTEMKSETREKRGSVYRVDRPFCFIIASKEMILGTGYVHNPTQ